MKKTLYISYYFLPSSVGAAQRVLSFSKYCKKVSPYILCPEKIDAIYTESLNLELPDRIKITRVSSVNLSFFRKAKSSQMKNETNSSPLYSLIFRFLKLFLYPDKGVFWMINAIKKGKQMVVKEGISTIVSTSPLFSNHIIAFFIKKKTNCKWICDIRDLHFVCNRENSKSLFRFMDKYIEKKALKFSDSLVFISDEMEKTYIDRYPFITGKTKVVKNGYDEKEMSIAKSVPKKKYHVLYAGNFYHGNGNPQALISSLSYLVDNQILDREDFYIEIIGHIEKELEKELLQYSLYKQIRIKGPQPREVVHQKMQQANLLWLITPDFKFLREGFALKGYEYLATGNRILAYVPKVSMSTNILNATQTGIVLSDKMDAKTIKENALKILNFINNKDFSPNWDEIQKYTREKQALIMEKIIIDL